ncbi:MAG: DNA repair protein RadC [Candidatus Saccharimonadales bacterium]
MTRMSDRRKNLRPREKLQARGAASLSDYELLMAIIGSGNKQADVTKIARKTLKLLKEHSRSITPGELMTVTGIGIAKCSEIIAAFELAERYSSLNSPSIIDSPEKAAFLLRDIRSKQQEHFVLMTLDGGNRLIEIHTISKGTLTASLVHPREVFQPAISDNAASIIVAHNHPSGNLQPSQADRDVTERLREAGELLGIKLLDHIIITKTSFVAI